SSHLELLADGTVRRWNPDIATPLSGSGSSNAVAIAANNYKELVLRPNGMLAGAALQGASLQISNLNNVVAIAQGLLHILVLTAHGSVFGWGNNPYGHTNLTVG